MPTDRTILNRSRERALFPTTNRLGVQYFDDTLHYRETDLHAWLPCMRELDISWLCLSADGQKAIPESFITSLVDAGIRPLLHFKLDLDDLPAESDLHILLQVYSRWGVREAIIFDQPNDRSAWSASSWAQPDLVDRFLDRYIPLANAALSAGITPIFPPLTPGGSYWDTVFLKSALESMVRRKQEKLAMSMGIAAYAWTFDQPLDWGLGGSISWPETRPYFTPPGSQDQKGFRIFEWYQEIARSALRTSTPLYLLQAGVSRDYEESGISAEDRASIGLSAAKLLIRAQDAEDDRTHAADIGPEVVCGVVGWLAPQADAGDPAAAWFDASARPADRLEEFSAWRARMKANLKNANRIKHYLLLPAYEWGIDEVHLEAIRPFLRKHKPAVGFSTEEAILAESVTVIGDEGAYTDEALNRLRQAGCKVERIQGDGTTIASLLSER